MKATRNILLIVGVAGLSAAFFALLNGDTFTDQLMTAVCSVCLIYGYVSLPRTKKTNN